MIGDLIKIFRKEASIGVMELSQKLGINRISLFRIEKGERQPSEETAIEAFKILGLSEENIYAIFVFNEMVRWKMIASSFKREEAAAFLRRLKTKDKHSKILYRYFRNVLNKQNHAKSKTKK